MSHDEFAASIWESIRDGAAARNYELNYNSTGFNLARRCRSASEWEWWGDVSLPVLVFDHPAERMEQRLMEGKEAQRLNESVGTEVVPLLGNIYVDAHLLERIRIVWGDPDAHVVRHGRQLIYRGTAITEGDDVWLFNGSCKGHQYSLVSNCPTAVLVDALILGS